MKPDAAARIFASHYQIVVCDDPTAFTEDTNWTDEDVARGFAGNSHFRMVGTEADLNDHWVEVLLTDVPPPLEPWDRVTCVDLECSTGKICVMSVLDDEAPITVDVLPGTYSAYVAGRNLGVDQNSLGEETELEDEQLAERKDLEWYRIFVVPGCPRRVGRLKTELVGETSSTSTDVPALKDPATQHPIATAWRASLRQLVAQLVAGDYVLGGAPNSVAAASQTAADQMKAYVLGHGETLIELPDDAWETSVSQWMGMHWDVLIDLWTAESGASDLVLACRVFEADAGFRFEVDSLYVP